MPLDLRKFSIASSASPSASTNAFLQSIMPRPVRSLRSLTIAAVIAAILISPVRFFLSDFIAGLGACAQENTDAQNSTADGDSFLKKFA
jgi:hypothetical protein